MSKPTAPPREPVSVVLPVHNAAATLPAAVRAWHDALGRLGVDSELLLVDDGSSDGTAAVANELAGKLARVRVMKHDTRRGFGACLRTALAEAAHPLFFYTALDYPYSPADLDKLLSRIAAVDEGLGRAPDVVSGCRTGRPVPGGWRAVGRVVRGFARFGLGLPLQPLPAWLGLRGHLRAWAAWAVYADPFDDPDSAFKLFRKAIFGRFPIQSDGDFVHVELAAKATFLACLMDEVPLTPKPDAIPTTKWGEFWKVFRDPQFTVREDETRTNHRDTEHTEETHTEKTPV